MRFTTCKALGALVVVAALVGCAQEPEPAGEATSAGEVAGDRTFGALVEGFHDDVQIFDSPRELAAAVDVVVRGSITGVTDGRRIFSATENIRDPGIDTLVFEVAVIEQLAGSRAASDAVFVEVQVVEQVAVADVAQSAPDDVVLFLSEVSTPGRMDGSRVENAQAGRPEGATLYSASAGGFLYEAGGEVVDLRLDLGELGPAWSDNRGSLDEVQAAVMGE